jgi:hypothetical protein
MAVKLMADYHLPTLKIRLNPAASPPEILCELELSIDEQRVVEQSWRCTTEEIGLPARLAGSRELYRSHTFRLPGHVIDGVRDWIHARDPDGPLWLHLVKPIGYLAVVPWEEILQERVGVPILRVPDFLSDPPNASAHRLEVVLCGSMPAAKEAFALPYHLADITQAALQIETRRNRRVHIFTDSQQIEAVRFQLEQRGLLTEQVLLHDPAIAAAFATPDAATRIAEGANRIDNPWLLWILAELRERSIDVVHFVSHGYCSHDQGALALAQSPLVNEDQRIARFVGTSQLSLFLTQLGAWSVFFSSPENNFSETGLRLLADNAAQKRPGPLVYHELRLDPACAMVTAAYRFLFGDGTYPPPATPALFTYCHPARVQNAEYETMAYSVFEAAPDLRAQEDAETPAWVSATERYMEQRVRDLEQSRAGPTSDLRQGGIEEVEKILAQVRDIVAKAASDTSTGAK